MPTVGVMLPQGSAAAGTGSATWVRHTVAPVAASRPYSEPPSVAATTRPRAMSGLAYTGPSSVTRQATAGDAGSGPSVTAPERAASPW
jgi:hypothetical protein